MNLYNVIKLAIEHGETDGLPERAAILFALGWLTNEQYTELAELLGGEQHA